MYNILLGDYYVALCNLQTKMSATDIYTTLSKIEALHL